MWEVLTPPSFVPSLLSYTSVPNVIKGPLTSISERTTSVQNALAEAISERRALRANVRQRKFAHISLQNATSYADWAAAAHELDTLEGRNSWKEDPVSPEYDYVLLQKRLQQFREARAAGDLSRVLFLLRVSLSRTFAHAGNPELYRHTNIGTKHVIEEYICEVQEALEFLLRAESPLVSDAQKLGQLTSLRQAYGRTALLLSGGGTLGMNHVGVLSALFERNMLPRIINGTSAGSIVAGVCCTRTDDELPQILNDFIHGDLNVFQDSLNPETVYDHIARLLKIGVWSDISYLTRVMQTLVGDLTFQEAYNRTRRILNITVSSANVYEMPRLLNYLTAPNVLIWSAIAASCSVPFIFSASELMAKDPKTSQPIPWNSHPQRWIDGSVDNDLPMAKLSELFNVNHFIVSQVNPHIVPFLEKNGTRPGGAGAAGKAESQEAANRVGVGPQGFVGLAVGEIMHRMHMLSELGIFPVLCTKVQSMLSQRYSGDITIVPDISYTDYPVLMSNPTPEFLVEARLRGERATWPKLSIIHNHCAIELAIDNAMYALNVKMVFGNATGLRHLRHRSHEPQVNERMWADSPPKRTTSTRTIHSLSTEVTPLDVENPTRKREVVHFHPSIVASHLSTPSTPAEETGVRKRLLNTTPLIPPGGMTFTHFDSAADEEEAGVDESNHSPLIMKSGRSSSTLLGDGMLTDEDTSVISMNITPPSTPNFTNTALGSPNLAYSARGQVKDASGTRRMMLKRKSSSFLRQTAQHMENGSRNNTGQNST